MSIRGNKKGLAGIAGLLITLVVLCLLVYLVVTIYMKNPLMDTATRRAVAEQGITMSNSGTIVDDVKKKVDEATKLMEKKSADREVQYK